MTQTEAVKEMVRLSGRSVILDKTVNDSTPCGGTYRVSLSLAVMPGFDGTRFQIFYGKTVNEVFSAAKSKMEGIQ